MSHVVAHLSALFPEGEDFFVRSVRPFADQITDSELKSRVQGFIGQEITHGREHRLLNERLQQMGYPTRRMDRMTHRDFKRFERLLSPLTCLAITAAFEHFTAVLAETLLSDERAQALLGRPRCDRCCCGTQSRNPNTVRSHSTSTVRSAAPRPGASGLCGSSSFTFTASVVFFSALSLLGDRAAYHRSGCSAVWRHCGSRRY